MEGNGGRAFAAGIRGIAWMTPAELSGSGSPEKPAENNARSYHAASVKRAATIWRLRPQHRCGTFSGWAT